jgi:hypothetical protein
VDGGAILVAAMGERSVNDSTAFDFARADRTSSGYWLFPPEMEIMAWNNQYILVSLVFRKER